MDETELRRLRWQCRRGMLELDVFLQTFFEARFAELTTEDQQVFIRLLAEEDQTLFLWLTGREQPTDQALAQMVQQVRNYVQSRRHA